jgi:uncharacterized protein YfaA (DUF2138 family)
VNEQSKCYITIKVEVSMLLLATSGIITIPVPVPVPAFHMARRCAVPCFDICHVICHALQYPHYHSNVDLMQPDLLLRTSAVDTVPQDILHLTVPYEQDVTGDEEPDPFRTGRTGQAS